VFTGRLVGIYSVDDASARLQSSAAIQAIEGIGLAGDRYAAGTGTYSARGGAGRAVTLIEREVVAAVNDDGVPLGEDETRRNLVTEGVPLHHLVGVTFRVGSVILQGVRPCPPCAHLESLTRAGVRTALENRGGLRADIVRGGLLRVGDEIAVVSG
jgi:MOSC domain-containing protein YiiM